MKRFERKEICQQFTVNEKQKQLNIYITKSSMPTDVLCCIRFLVTNIKLFTVTESPGPVDSIPVLCGNVN